MAMAMMNAADSDSDDDYDDEDDDRPESEMIVTHSEAASEDSRPSEIHHSVAPSELLSSAGSFPHGDPARASVPMQDTGSLDARNLSAIKEQEPAKDQESDASGQQADILSQI